MTVIDPEVMSEVRSVLMSDLMSYVMSYIMSGMAVVLTEDSRRVDNVEKEAVIELLMRTVHYHLKENLALHLDTHLWSWFNDWPPTKLAQEVRIERTKNLLRVDLNRWRVRDENCDITRENYLICLPCLAIKTQNVSGNERREKQCIFTSVRKLLNELTYDQTGNISKLFARVFY